MDCKSFTWTVHFRCSMIVAKVLHFNAPTSTVMSVLHLARNVFCAMSCFLTSYAVPVVAIAGTSVSWRSKDMRGLVTHHFLFITEVISPLELDDHSGAALRGNLFDAVWGRFCNNK